MKSVALGKGLGRGKKAKSRGVSLWLVLVLVVGGVLVMAALFRPDMAVLQKRVHVSSEKERLLDAFAGDSKVELHATIEQEQAEPERQEEQARPEQQQEQARPERPEKQGRSEQQGGYAKPEQENNGGGSDARKDVPVLDKVSAIDFAKVINDFCKGWNCDCQTFSDAYGTSHKKKSFGTAPDSVQRWWLDNECHTDPGPNKGNVPLPVLYTRPREAGVTSDDAKTKYLTFAWNAGRLNNNLMSLTGAMALAKNLSRTIIIEQPKNNIDNALYQHIGVLEGLWDLDFAREHGYKFVFEHDVPPEIAELMKDNKKCAIGSYKKGTPPAEADYKTDDCRVVQFGTNAFFYMKNLEDKRRKVGSVEPTARYYMRPAKWIRDASDAFLSTHFPKESPRVSAHQRHHAWGDEAKHGSSYLCRGKLRNMASVAGDTYRSAVQHWKKDDSVAQMELLNITEISCGMTFGEMQKILRYFKQPVIGPGEKFFLATDSEVPESLDVMQANGAVTISLKDLQAMPSVVQALQNAMGANLVLQHNCAKRVCPPRKKFADLAYILADSWCMVRGSFFVGGYYSTMSETVCEWRGKELMYDSNYCFLAQRMRKGRVLSEIE
jgi:hypothetical protein